jgi:hypothetical protein
MVRRSRRSDRAPFWGCPNFPGCRGTRPIEAIEAVRPDESATSSQESVPWDDPSWQRGAAGASARASYERRRERHRARVKSARPLILLTAAAVALAGIGLMTVSPTWSLAGWALVAVATLGAATRLFVLPDHVRAWDIGARGEERMAQLLDELEGDGFIVLHDRHIRGRRENIDHIVIGPPGVVIVEVKNYTGRVRVRGRDLYVGGRRKTEFVDQAQRQIDAVRAVVDNVPATAILAFPRGDFPLFGTPRLAGIEARSAKGTIRRIRRMPESISESRVRQIASDIDTKLPRA